jgi:drug/metabolite transporter (DMT)-like permease
MEVKQNYLVFAAVGITVFLWESSFAAIEIALVGYQPGHLALLRFIIASISMLVYAVFTRMKLPELRDMPAIGLLGLTGFTIYHVAQNSGQQTISAGTASFLVATAPVFTALLALIFLKERLAVWGWVGISISFLGTAIISFGAGDSFELAWGAILVLIAALSVSIYFVFQKPYLQKYSGLQLTTFTIWMGTFFMLIYAPGLTNQISSAPVAATLAVVYLGVLATALAYVLWAYALARVNVSVVTNSLNLLPILSILIAWLWLGEIPTPTALLGGLVTLFGVMLLHLYGKLRSQDNQ